LGGDCLATGHYVQRILGGGAAELHAGADPKRDQSYFLFATTQTQLDYLRFPLGGLSKTETRTLAERFDLPVAAKPDSQDICFVPNGDYTSVVERLRPGAADPGDIRHVDGRVLGRHAGIIHFTVGQRRGIAVNDQATSNEPLYVVRVDPKRREVIVGPKAALARDEIRLREVNWLGARSTEPLAVTVKIRSMSAPAAARISFDGDGATVALETPQFGVAPGQACVVYQGGRVLGGGWIRRQTEEIARRASAA
jgi:tRNA-specific 2-thiouridylase